MKKLLIFTFNRAEFGFLKPLIEGLEKNKKKIKYKLFVGGTHFDKLFGNTFKEIDQLKYLQYNKLFLLDNNKQYKVEKSIKKIDSVIKNFKPDLIFLPGDRHELLLIAYSALLNKVPLAHYGGGQITEGSADNQVRNSISKLSHLHFVSTRNCKKNLIKIGEQSKRIFVTGSLGITNIKREKIISKSKLNKKYKFNFNNDFFLITIHPNSINKKRNKIESNTLFKSLSIYKNLQFIITSPNNDPGFEEIKKIIKRYTILFPKKFIFIPSLGNKNYLSALSYSRGIIGNSSSGIIEAPSLGIPTINLGDRQQKRYRNKSVIDCAFNKNSIKRAIKKCFSQKFLYKINSKKNIYYKKNTEKIIINRIINENLEGILKKK